VEVCPEVPLKRAHRQHRAEVGNRFRRAAVERGPREDTTSVKNAFRPPVVVADLEKFFPDGDAVAG